MFPAPQLAVIEEPRASFRQRVVCHGLSISIVTVGLVLSTLTGLGFLEPPPEDMEKKAVKLFLPPRSEIKTQEAAPRPEPSLPSPRVAPVQPAAQESRQALAEIDVAGIRLRIVNDDTQQLPAVVALHSGFVAYVTPKSAFSNRLFGRSGSSDWQELDQTAELDGYWCLRLPRPGAWRALAQLTARVPLRADETVWVLLPGGFVDRIRMRIDQAARQRGENVKVAEIRLDGIIADGFTIVSLE